MGSEAGSGGSDRPRRRSVQVPAGRPLSDLGERPARGLVERARATDRDERFGERMAAVRARTASRARRARARELALDGLALVVGVVVGAAVGVFTNGWVGVAVALGVAAAGLAGRRLAGRLAARRGATAWDWQAGRHRLLGRPANRVQDLDRRDRRPPGPLG